MPKGCGDPKGGKTCSTLNSLGLARTEDFQVAASDGGGDFLGLSDVDVEVQGWRRTMKG